MRSGFAQTRTMREESPELLHRILDVLATRIGEYLCYQIDSGAQVVQCFDSWAGHLDPEAFDEFAAPYLRRVVEVVKRERPGTPTIVYIAPAEHSRNGALLDRLAATGADIVGIDHTTDLAEARALLGARGVGTQGNLDPDLLRNGPIDAIERAAAEVLAAAKAPGGAHMHRDTESWRHAGGARRGVHPGGAGGRRELRFAYIRYRELLGRRPLPRLKLSQLVDERRPLLELKLAILVGVEAVDCGDRLVGVGLDAELAEGAHRLARVDAAGAVDIEGGRRRRRRA